jgi:hypothetical protein
MLGKLISASSIISIVLVAILLQITSPANIGPLGIFVFFILLYVSVLGMLTYLIFCVSQLLVKVPLIMTTAKRGVSPFSLRRAYYFSSVLALAPVMIIGMQSVDEVGIYETLLVVFFTVIACVYISKRTS